MFVSDNDLLRDVIVLVPTALFINDLLRNIQRHQVAERGSSSLVNMMQILLLETLFKLFLFSYQ